MGGGGGAGLAGASGGEATGGGAAGRETTAAGLAAGSGTLAAGFMTRVSPSCPLRLPNTTILHAGGSLAPQLFDQGRQERAPRLLGFAASCQPLRDLQKHLGGAMVGGDLRDHLAVVGGRT